MSRTPNPESAELPDDWIETKANAVKAVLSEMTTVYNEAGNTIPVEFDGKSYCDSDGEYIAINPAFWQELDPPVTGPNILRILDDILAHEVGHYNWSDLDSKREFGELYDDWGDIPGHVANILEDEYVDARRMRKWYGMRSKRAYRVLLQAETDDLTPPVDTVYEEHGEVNAYLAAMHQVALFGTAKGLSEAPDALAEFCQQVAPVIERVRRQDDANERFKLFHVAMELLTRYVDRPDDFDPEDYADGPARAISGEEDDGMGESMPAPDADAPTDEASDAVAEMISEMVDEVTPDDDEAAAPDTASGDESETTMEAEIAESEVTDADSDSEESEMSAGADDTDMSTGRGPDDDIEADEATHHIDGREMVERELVDGVEDRYDVRIDDIDKADERDRERWASLVKSLHEYELDLERRKRERDERIAEHRDKWTGYHANKRSENLRERAENAGVIRELKDGFEELVSRNVPRPARRGTRIDAHNVARRASGDMTVRALFEEEQVVETGDRCVGFATDISGSMGSGIDELKIAGAAVAKATEIIGDEFVWEAFTDRDCPDHLTPPEGRLDLRVVTGPNEDFDWEHVDSFTSAANEPTAAGIRDCFTMMQETDANQYVMIVVTDGVALVEEDGALNRHGNTPVEHARQAVNEIRSNGVDVIGLGVGSMDDRKMEETFGGNNYRLTELNSLSGDILDLYRDQLDTVEVRR